MHDPKITPELDVDNLDLSLDFYTRLIGFTVVFARDEEKFAFLDLDGAQIMLQQAAGPGRRFRTAPLERPYGRGMNLQIEIEGIDDLYKRLNDSEQTIVVPIEDKWYRVDQSEAGNRQFVVADPDGYLLRFFQNLGKR